MLSLIHKRIVLGITGGIAAYKSAELVRQLREAGAEVRVVMTQTAQEFITPLTLETLSNHQVYTHWVAPHIGSTMAHIELARWADLVLIAPGSAEFMANLAHGHAHDLLSTLCLATTARIALAPAMNQQMWYAQATQENLRTLLTRNIILLGPAAGNQACGEVGPGRMLEPQEITSKVSLLFHPGLFQGTHIVITAGPTHENIDPVRYITNYSSGKMGYALAQAAVEAGATVTLISGPTALTPPEHVNFLAVSCAQEMYDSVFANVPNMDILIANAAVADYRCQHIAATKIAKTMATLQLELIRTPDILADVSALKERPFIVGFAAETEQVLEKARAKLKAKNMHMIAANQVGLPDRGFSTDTNALTVIWEDGQCELELASKPQIARHFMKILAERYSLYEKNST